MNEIKFSQDYVLYRAKKEGIYPIKETDWKRLKRQVESIIPYKTIFQILSSIGFGVWASSIFSLIAFSTTSELKAWVMPMTWILFFVSLFCGIGFLILDKIQNKILTMSSSDILLEMQDIEKSFDKDVDE